MLRDRPNVKQKTYIQITYIIQNWVEKTLRTVVGIPYFLPKWT